MSADSSHFRLAEASVRLDSMPAGGRDVELAEGTELNTSLASPYSVRVEVK